MSDHPSGFRSQVSGLEAQSSARLLEHFRASKQRLPLHPLEKAVLAAVAIHLCFLPWALGTMHPWSQVTSLVLSATGLILALIPRNYSPELSGAPALRLNPLPRLLHFPLFWLGLTLLGYLALQASNPSWVWTRNATSWWLVRVNDIAWLPTSIDTPFERFNLWRQFIIYASAWLTVCAIWTGFTRRRALELLLTALGINAVVVTLVGFIARFYFPTWEWILWLNSMLRGASSFSSFIYKNHAAGYLALLAGVGIALAAWHHERGLRNMARSTPGMLWLLGSVAMAFGVFYTYSRGATVLLAGYFILATAAYLVARLFSKTHSTTSPLVWVVITVLLLGAVGFGASQLNYGEAENKFTALLEKPAADVSVAHRMDAYAAAQSMLSDYWHRGVGAGGFRYLFPEYIKHYPNSYGNGQLFWEHAHCDWLQLPIELGVTGALLVALGGLWTVWRLFRLKLWLHPAMLLLVLACLQAPAQAAFDFPFQNPAILCTWLGLLALSLRWVELESV
jgi:hypothetical protein